MDETIPCEICTRPTRMRATKRCDGCWEVEQRLSSYLRDGGQRARQFVLHALIERLDAPYLVGPKAVLVNAMGYYLACVEE